MRTAIRNLGWLFLFSGGLKSLIWLMGFYGTYHHKLHNHHKTHNHQPPPSSLQQTKDGLPSLVVRPQLLFRRSIQNIKELNKYKFSIMA